MQLNEIKNESGRQERLKDVSISLPFFANLFTLINLL